MYSCRSVFFFKQKTAYEVRISDWSSDVCSSDLPERFPSPLLNIVSTTDRIVPHSSAFTGGERLDLASGPVGMVVGGRARSDLWESLAAWLSRSGRECSVRRNLSEATPMTDAHITAAKPTPVVSPLRSFAVCRASLLDR